MVGTVLKCTLEQLVHVWCGATTWDERTSMAGMGKNCGLTLQCRWEQQCVKWWYYSGSEESVYIDVDLLRWTKSNVLGREAVYIRAGAGSGSVMGTDAKAVEELLTCSGWAGWVRGQYPRGMRLRP
jgi:hypothetical protein